MTEKSSFNTSSLNYDSQSEKFTLFHSEILYIIGGRTTGLRLLNDSRLSEYVLKRDRAIDHEPCAALNRSHLIAIWGTRLQKNELLSQLIA